MKRKIIVALSDTHGGSKYGLLNPETVLYDQKPSGELVEYCPELTASQVYLWNLYSSCVKRIEEIAAGDSIVVVHCGDGTQGNWYPSELSTSRMSDHVLIAISNLKPIMEIEETEVVRLNFGTGVHNFGEGSAEILMGNFFRNTYPDKDFKFLEHGLLTTGVGGISIDYAHHGPFPGSRVWLRGNVVRYYLRDIMQSVLMNGKTPPDLVLRGHYHQYVREQLSISAKEREFTSTIILLPSFSFLGSFVRRATRSVNTITNGLVVFEVYGNTIAKVHRLTKTLDIRTKEVLSD